MAWRRKNAIKPGIPYPEAQPLEPRRLLAIVAAGAESHANSFTFDDQFAPVVAAALDGQYVVVWVSNTQDGDASGIMARRFSAADVPIGGEFSVNTITAGDQFSPAVAMDTDGDFVIAWTNAAANGAPDVMVRRFSKTGAPLDPVEFRANVFTTGAQQGPSVAMNSTGDFVVAWDSNLQDGSSYGVYARRFAANGTALGGEMPVNQTTAGLQADPSVAMDYDGDFVIAWTSGSAASTSQYDIFARRYTAAGTAAGGEFQVNTFTTDYQTQPSAGMDFDGDFVIAWSSYGQDGSQYGVYAKRYSAAGAALGAEFRANSTTSSNQTAASVGMNAAGDFLIAFASDTGDGSGKGIFARSYNSAGVVQDVSNVRLNSWTTGDQTAPSVSARMIAQTPIAWESQNQNDLGEGIYARRFVGAESTPPVVSEVKYEYVTNPRLTVRFSETLIERPKISDFYMMRFSAPSGALAAEQFQYSYNPITLTATFIYIGAANHAWADGDYQIAVVPWSLFDMAGNQLDGDGNGLAGGVAIKRFFSLGGDTNHDHVVNIVDLRMLAANFNATNRTFAQGDFDYNNVVDKLDLAILARNWNSGSTITPLPVDELEKTLVIRPRTRQYVTELVDSVATFEPAATTDTLVGALVMPVVAPVMAPVVAPEPT
jgi:hypothetical protein